MYNKYFIQMNLQLFAGIDNFYAGENTMHGTATNAGVVTGLTPEMKTFYSKQLIETAGPDLVYAQFGEKVSIGQGKGKQIEWRQFGKFQKALTPLTEGVTPVASTLMVTTKTKVVDQFGDWSIVTDLLEMTAIDPVIAETTTRHAQNAKLTLDTIVRDELMKGEKVLYADTVISGTASKTAKRSLLTLNCKWTADTAAQVTKNLRKLNAPTFDGSYVVIVHPSCEYDIMKDPEFVDVVKYGDAVRIFNQEIGKMRGLRFVRSTEAKIFRGKPLAESGSTKIYKLTGGTYTSGTKTLAVTGTTLVENALTGRTLRVISTTSSTVTEQVLHVASNATNSITFSDTTVTDPTGSGVTVTIVDNEATNEGYAVYGALAIAKGAYKVVDLNGENAEIIVKPRGSGGTEDPLNQRSTIGWKVNGYGAAIVIEDYLLRVETCATDSPYDDAN